VTERYHRRSTATEADIGRHVAIAEVTDFSRLR
jgi:hypothetical protein